jgi:uncharacterized cupin superfamily protein
MKKYKLENFTRGWLVGDFEPSIIRTKDFEVMVRAYHSGDKESKHLHKVADEITVIVSGVFLMNGERLSTGDIIHLSPGDPTDFECLEDGSTTVIKTPSMQGDKFIID